MQDRPLTTTPIPSPSFVTNGPNQINRDEAKHILKHMQAGFLPYMPAYKALTIALEEFELNDIVATQNALRTSTTPVVTPSSVL